MAGLAVALVVSLGLVACGSGSGAGGWAPFPEEGAARWVVDVSVEPASVGEIAVSVGPARPAPENDARPWVRHDLVFENTGDRAVRFADTRSSAFLGPPGAVRTLIAADDGCGYGRDGEDGPIEVGACTANLDAFVVVPGRPVTRTVTLFHGLRGMDPLAPGAYVFERPVRFHAGADVPAPGTGRAALLRLRYEVSRESS